MSNYKVGDLASLMSPKKTTTESKLQSLFNEHWNKRQIPIALKNAKNTKNQQKSSKCDIESNTVKKNKRKKASDSLSSEGPLQEEMKTDFNSDFLPLPSKKKQKKEKKRKLNFSEDLVVEKSEQDADHSENVKSFIRCAKNKRQKPAGNSVDTSSVKPVRENLFNEFPESEDTSNNQIKKQKSKKKKKIPNQSEPLSMDSEEEETSQAVVNKVDVEKIRQESIQDLPCTLFVGNLPVSVNRKMLHKLFTSFGQIKSVRMRGAVSTKMGIPKKVAEIKSEYHKGLQSHTGFVVFKDKESAKNALSLNGTLIDDHHILVDFANQPGEKKLYNNELSVFLGNLPFDVADETVRSAFEECGEIQAVRIVRDKNTGVGKGFGYIQFQKIKAKEKALTLDDVEINSRKIRVKPVDNNPGGKTGPKKTVMAIRSNMAMKRTKQAGSKKSVKKLLKKGKHVHQKKKIARLFGEKFVK
ncbi:RNA-binding protein 34 [Parasteatoda tepidariorum]|nr:RNA-binding protein 34 [Parasteatoda tepidariorum]